MIAQIKKLLHDCLTENDGTSFDGFKTGGFALSVTGIPTFIGLAIYTTVKSQHFEMIAFGTGFAAIMGGMAMLAGGVAMKAKTDTQ